jgi:branched-chain amino acid transport system permease protein
VRQFLVIGLFTGAIYGLLAVGLVLVYKGARVFNFAQGEFGTVAAYVVWTLHANGNAPYGLAVFAGLVVAVALGLAVERLVVRPLFHASRITLLVATVGVALFIIGATFVGCCQDLDLFGKAEVRVLAPAIGGNPLIIFDTAILPQQILALVVLGALAVALWAFFSRTNLGLAVLATSQDPLATRIVGIGLPGMSRFIWGFAALLGGIAGIVAAPISGLTPGFMTTIWLVPAFAGAVLGGMTSLPGAFIGGMLVGVAQNLGIYFLEGLAVPGPSELTVFALLLLVLLIRPQGLLGKEA